jgi:hypothetical protein
MDEVFMAGREERVARGIGVGAAPGHGGGGGIGHEAVTEVNVSK